MSMLKKPASPSPLRATRSLVTAALIGAAPSLLAASALAGTCPPAPVGCDQSIELTFLGRWSSGLYNAGGAEISAHDPVSQRVFVVNGGNKSIEILSIANPANPTLIGTIPMAPYGNAANSVAVRNGVVAVAIEAVVKTDPGVVAFFDVDGGFLASVPVGALPDMLTFTPDGTKVLVANEGEPNDSYTIDPAGSVSIIDLSGGVRRLSAAQVTTVGFAGVAVDPEIVVRAPNATMESDLEPEYIAVSADGTTAWVTIQEANAVGILDIASASFTAVKWLGGAEHGRGTPVLQTATLQNPPSLGLTAAGQSIALGGFSGLWFESIDSATGVIRVVTHTDRGPNGEPVDIDSDGVNERPFALPGFQPRLVRLDYNPTAGTLTLVNEILLKDTDGTPLTGLPNILGQSAGLAYTDEEPVDLFGQPIALDAMGLDLEGLVKTPDGSWWMGDEYRPSIVRFAADGTLISRYVPAGSNAFGATTGIEALPAVYAQRRANRGFEAIAQYDGQIFAWIQSPIDNPDLPNDNSSKASRSVRMLQFDPVTETVVAEYLYRIEGSGSDKMGDAVAIGPNRFLVIERDDGLGTNKKKKIFEIDTTNATDLSTLSPAIAGPGGTLELMTEAQLASNGIVPVTKKVVVDLAAIGYANVADKVEGLAMVDPSRLLVIGDNDFGMPPTFDPVTGLLPANPNALPSVLGFITFTGQGLDPSDQDGGIRIAGWPILGQYRPDSIDAVEIDGTEYIVLANEGDAREYAAYAEEANGSTLNLDPNAFPAASWLKANARLGRLRFIKDQGDLDGDGDLDLLWAYGSRSFSVRAADGSLVWDSGDLIERITAATFPANFNASNTSNTFDSRSRNKGPEPEAIEIGSVNGTPYVFVGLERVGGVMAFDMTNPAAPEFEQYINTRNFSQSPSNPLSGDLGVEGLHFIAAEDSPTGGALLVAANEISGTISIYAVDPLCGVTPGDLVADCIVDAADLGFLLGAWGPCADPQNCAADLNGDGSVDAGDLAILLGNWS
jgi:hypothetical protein